METERAGRLSNTERIDMAKHDDRVILVTGATGHQGGAAIRHLQQKHFAVRAVTRDPNQPKARDLAGHGTEVVRANLDDADSLARALDGVYGVYSVQDYAGGAESEIRQGINLADAANRSGVSQFVYSSVGSADKNTGIPHFESKFRIEEHIRGTGLPFSILRPVFFMENWLGMKGGIEAGTLALPLAPETRLQMIAVDDIGAFVALAFEHPDKWNGRALDIAGDELSMTELADAFGRVSGREVSYRQVPWEQFEQQAGPEMTSMYKWFQDVGYDIEIPAIRREYPRLTSFEKWIQTNWRVAAGAAG
jgi:uncharacterized protein YbjT (DUF2867 family)